MRPTHCRFAIPTLLVLVALLSVGCHDNAPPPDVAAAYSNAASNLDDYDPNV